MRPIALTFLRASARRRRALSVAVMVFGCVLSLAGCVERSTPVGRNVEPLGPIFAGQSVRQTFVATGPSLVAIDIRFGTYARQNSGTIAVHLYRPAEAAPLRTAQVPATQLVDGEVHRFRLAPALGVSRGETLQVEVVGDAPGPDQGVAVWAMPAEDSGQPAAAWSGPATGLSLVWSPVYGSPWPPELVARAAALLASGRSPWAAVMVVLGPGLLLVSLLLDRRSLGPVARLAAAPGFGLAAAPLLMLGLSVLGLRWTEAGVWALGLGSLLIFLSLETWRSWQKSRAVNPTVGEPQSVHSSREIGTGLALVVLGGVAVRDLALAGALTPPGADIYHHSLITQLLINQGSVPFSYQPYAPIDSFAYHFGFHSLAAFIGLAGGLSGREAVAMATPLVNALIAPSFFVLAVAAGLGPRVGLLAAGLVAVGLPFPAALLDLGRAPQAAALAVLPLAISLVLLSARSAAPLSGSPARLHSHLATAAGLVAAGLFLTHYRVAIYLGLVGLLAALAVVAWLARARMGKREAGADLRRILPLATTGLLATAIALVLVSPWLWRLSQQFALGIRGSEGRYGPAYYSLERLGASLSSPAMFIGLGLAAIGLVIAIRRHQLVVPLLGAWAIVQLTLSNPAWLPIRITGLVDMVTVTSSLFVALAPAAAVALEAGYCAIAQASSTRRVAAVGSLVALAAVGALQIPSYIHSSESLLAAGDVHAAAWIANELPPSARFAVNAAVLDWEPDYVTPTDGGYWLPLLAARPTTLLPVLYPGERGVRPSDIVSMEALVRALQHDPASESTRALLRDAGVTHVYLGVHGGPIDERKLESSPFYHAVYRRDGVAIFELTERLRNGAELRVERTGDWTG